MRKLTPLFALWLLGCASYDGLVSAKGYVITPENRPADNCAVAITTSPRRPRESWYWRRFQGRFVDSDLSQYKRTYIHVECAGWAPVVRELVYDERGWSTDSVTFFPIGEPVDLGTIILRSRS